jgi:hypothetical protein
VTRGHTERVQGWYHVRARVTPEHGVALREVARRRGISISQLLRSLVTRELADAESGSGGMPDESAIREMAILVAVELVLKLQEASIPGGVTLSRRLLEDAAGAAIGRVELVESRLKQETDR